MNVHNPKTPFIFKAASFLIFVIWLAIFGLIAWAVYTTLISGIGPEDVGSFFGKIANGFQRELQ